MRSLVVKEDISSERRSYGRDREMVSPGKFSETVKEVGEKETRTKYLSKKKRGGWGGGGERQHQQQQERIIFISYQCSVTLSGKKNKTKQKTLFKLDSVFRLDTTV